MAKKFLIPLTSLLAVGAMAISASAAMAGNYSPNSKHYNAVSTNTKLATAAGVVTCKSSVIAGATGVNSPTASITGEAFNKCEREGEPATVSTSGTWSLKDLSATSTEVTIGGATISLSTAKCTITVGTQKVTVAWENGSGELNPSLLTLAETKLALGGTCGATEGKESGTYAVVDTTTPTEAILQS